jgi:hypothetical protein
VAAIRQANHLARTGQCRCCAKAAGLKKDFQSILLLNLRKSNSDTLIKGLRPGQKLKVLIDNGQPAI